MHRLLLIAFDAFCKRNRASQFHWTAISFAATLSSPYCGLTTNIILVYCCHGPVLASYQHSLDRCWIHGIVAVDGPCSATVCAGRWQKFVVRGLSESWSNVSQNVQRIQAYVRSLLSSCYVCRGHGQFLHIHFCDFSFRPYWHGLVGGRDFLHVRSVSNHTWSVYWRNVHAVVEPEK